MGMQINAIDLLQLQTKYMQQDDTTKALCAAIEPILNEIAGKIQLLNIVSGIDDLPEQVLDELAISMHIEWYDTKAPLSTKRNLIRSSDAVHCYLGTPYAVEQVVKDYFGEAQVEEWFEYGGNPYTFRVKVSPISPALQSQFTRAVNAVKNLRSQMELVIIYNTYQDLSSHTHAALHAYTHDQLREADL